MRNFNKKVKILRNLLNNYKFNADKVKKMIKNINNKNNKLN